MQFNSLEMATVSLYPLRTPARSSGTPLLSPRKNPTGNPLLFSRNCQATLPNPLTTPQTHSWEPFRDNSKGNPLLFHRNCLATPQNLLWAPQRHLWEVHRETPKGKTQGKHFIIPSELSGNFSEPSQDTFKTSLGNPLGNPKVKPQGLIF